MANKVRLDTLLVERGLIETREKAKRTIMAGLVFSDGNRLDKPGVKVDADLSIQVKGKAIPYVGRGGLKLEKAIKSFQINLQDRTMVDIGSSTGGFTDCALQNGAEKCYAVDVGYNQLDWKLRNDPRVIVMERTNFRYATVDLFEKGLPDFASIDVSFISLRLILPVLKTILAPESDVVALIKPQFEAGRDQVGKKGIVRDKTIHKQVVSDMLTFANDLHFNIENITYSPITGGDGNIEFLAHLTWNKSDQANINGQQLDDMVEQVIAEAHHVHE